MKKYIIITMIALGITSCKTKAVAVQNSEKTTAIEATDNKTVIAKHYENKQDYTTIYLKANAKYATEKQSHSVGVEIRIERDKQILVSVRFLGITMAKALITPTAVSYYEKMNGTYYEGDFTSLSAWLGTELDYQKVQNLLVGQAIDDLKKEKYTQSIVDNLFKLQEEKESKFSKSFFIDGDKYLLQKEEISQASQNKTLSINYLDHKIYDQGIFPMAIDIQAVQAKGNIKIALNYSSISFNEELSFPYSIPSGYKKVIIK